MSETEREKGDIEDDRETVRAVTRERVGGG